VEVAEVAINIGADIGEGPHWDSATNTLIFVDSTTGVIFRFDPNSGETSLTTIGKPIGAAIPRKGGGYVVTSHEGLLYVEECPNPQINLLVPIETELVSNRMNDAKCDSLGRLWSGTFSTTFDKKAGSLYRVDPNLSLVRMLPGVSISNGIGWSPDERLMYFVDTAMRRIDVFDFNISEGHISSQRIFVNIPREAGLPDGMTVDAEGCVWVALYYGGQIRRYSPTGELLQTVKLPVSRVTSCTFGGPNMSDLYITTARHASFRDGKPQEPFSGSIFRYRSNTRGLPAHTFTG